MTNPRPSIEEFIRERIEASGVSAYRIALDAGVDQSKMSRFRSGQSGLHAETLGRIAGVLGLRLVRADEAAQAVADAQAAIEDKDTNRARRALKTAATLLAAPDLSSSAKPQRPRPKGKRS